MLESSNIGMSPDLSPEEDVEDPQWQTASTDDAPNGTDGSTGLSDHAAKGSVPLQKRRRVTRACDECRRKKIKCDGKQPCTHCTVYSYDCTYDQPSNRRRNPAPQYIEALEARLQKAEALLRVVLPNVDLDDPKVEARGTEQVLAMARQRKIGKDASERLDQAEKEDAVDDAQLESMVQTTGSLDLDDHGNWDYHGHSSGYLFLRRLRAQMGEAFGDSRLPPARKPPKSQMLDTPRSTSESPFEHLSPNAQDLPPREVAKALCRNALDDCCALMRFIHQPSFYKKLDKLYSTDPERYTDADVKFLPLLYLVIAVGCMFSTAEDNRLDIDGYEKYMGQGYQYFNAGRQMIDITDTRDLTGIQAICFMIIFLQSTAKLSTCYAYVGIALRACLRLGLHRNVNANFDVVEQQQRKRVFWLVRKMDAYVSAMLGLPQMVSDEDIDQDLPAEVDDDRITPESLLAQPSPKFPLIKATNAHTRLTAILKKVVRYVYPIKDAKQGIPSSENGSYVISHAKIREIEGDLQVWMDELPMELRPSDNAPQDLARVQQLLRISYAHLQMMLYRPFLHYVSGICQSAGVDKRTFACAAACVSVARNIVHITSEMKRRGLLIGAYWFVMYTTYFAIVSLVYFCLENPLTYTGREILKDAIEGRDTLASLARRSLAADRCTQSLEGLFKGLPEKIQDRKKSLASSNGSHPKKRPQPNPTTEYSPKPGHRSSPPLPATTEPSQGLPRANTFPTSNDSTVKGQKDLGHQRITSTTEETASFRPNPQSWHVGNIGISTPDSGMSFSEQVQASPQAANQDLQFGNPNLPDLKNVMFPSDNPFAYPNQPISALEAQFTPDAQVKFTNFYMPSGGGTTNTSYNSVSDLSYPNHPPFRAPNQSTRTMGNEASYSGITEGVDISSLQHSNNFVSAGQTENYWPQMPGISAGPPPTVNLDDLFGNEQWASSWNGPMQ